MNRFFFFGYSTPTDMQTNLEYDTDFESCIGVWIASESEQEALDWGRAIAECFVNWLCEKEGKPSYSWIKSNFAHKIVKNLEDYPFSSYLPIVRVGEMPDFTLLKHPD